MDGLIYMTVVLVLLGQSPKIVDIFCFVGILCEINFEKLKKP